jgi:3-hydroxy-9,10-secoandrosta-1,3,5(10)-triene-9,17-dione monooxygenase
VAPGGHNSASMTASANPTRDALIERARDLIPVLRERAAEAEALRRLPDATHAAFRDAGLYRLYQPRRYGGYEADYQLQIDIAAELGRGCGSSAWVQSILASHSWVHGMLGQDAQDEVWGKTPDAIIASGFPTRGASATPVEGGFVVDGRWSFTSGVDHCEWSHLNLLLPRPGQPPQHYFAAVPARDYRIVDDWHVAGMRGTGSKSIELAKIFVPAHRALDTHACVGGPTAGSALSPGPLFRMPLFALFAHGIVGPAVGMALGALDEVLAPLRAARRSQAGLAVADQPTVQVRLAEASAEIDAARAILKAASDEATALAQADMLPTLEQRVRWRRNGAYAGSLCLRAVERLHPLAGANGLADTSPFQRAFRDIHGACAHIALTWDVQAANYGGVLLGRASTDPKL